MEASSNIRPSESYINCELDGDVKIRLGLSDNALETPPVLLSAFVRQRCRSGKDKIALSVVRQNQILSWTYQEYYENILTVSEAFISLGLEPFHSVGIYASNCPEWFLASLGAVFAGGIVVGLSLNNSLRNTERIVNESKVQILVVQNKSLYKSLLSLQFEYVLKIVLIHTENNDEDDDENEDEDYDNNNNNLLNWSDLLNSADGSMSETLQERMESQAVNNCCAVFFEGKNGILISQDNIYFSALSTVREHKWMPDEILYSFLPLDRVGVHIADIYVSLRSHASVFFHEESPSIIDGLTRIRPTRFFATPSVYEDIQKILRFKLNSSAFDKAFVEKFKAGATNHHIRGHRDLTYLVGSKVFYEKVKKLLGLENVKEFSSGGAPMSESTLHFFASLDIVIHEILIRGEGSGRICGNRFNSMTFGSFGVPYKDIMLKVSEENEICIWGRNVMMGYLNNPHKSRLLIDSLDSWLHTTLLGHVNKQDFLYLTGRTNETILTSDGETIYPKIIEDMLRHKLPILSHVMVVGEGSSYLSALLTLDVIWNFDLPTGSLSKKSLEWIKNLGSTSKTVDHVLRGPDKKVMRGIQFGIDDINDHTPFKASQIRKWTILPKDFSEKTGEIEFDSLKRSVILSKYKGTVSKLTGNYSQEKGL